MLFFLLLVYCCFAGEIVYSNKEYGWELNDSALIDYYEYPIDGSYWLGGNMQRFDILKFNGHVDTVELDYLCWTALWTSEDPTLKMKVRMLPYEFRDDESSETGYIVRVSNNTQKCVKIRGLEFDPKCGSVVKYVSIQLYQTLENSKSFVYFNDILFTREPSRVDIESESESEVIDGGFINFILLAGVLMLLFI